MKRSAVGAWALLSVLLISVQGAAIPLRKAVRGFGVPGNGINLAATSFRRCGHAAKDLLEKYPKAVLSVWLLGAIVALSSIPPEVWKEILNANASPIAFDPAGAKDLFLMK